MFTWEQVNRIRAREALANSFTEKERARLEALRRRYIETHNCTEFGLDVQRLRYVRWMVAHGHINEGEEYDPR